MPTVDVIVPVYGHWEVVEPCLRALLKQTHDLHLLVVDDCSPDDTADRIEAAFEGIDLLRLPRNRGFAGACNAAFELCDGDVVVLVNSDVVSAPDMIQQIVEPFVEQSVGSVAPLILQPDGRVDALGICADVTLAGFVRYHGSSTASLRRSGPVLLGPYGAVAAYRRAAVPGQTLFDEGIFMYGEELDLALRLRLDGWGAALATGATAEHLGGATTGTDSPRQRYLAGFGRGYLLRKYGVLRSRYWVRALLVEVVVSLLRIARSRDLASARGRVAGWRGASGVSRLAAPTSGLDPSIGALTSIRMRSRAFWAQF